MDVTIRVVSCPGVDRALARELIVDEACRTFAIPRAAARVRQQCPSCGSSRHGRPVLAPVPGIRLPHVSISRADALTVVALTNAGPVGVDVERSTAASFPGFGTVGTHRGERPGTPRERTVRWVRKESLLKATGQGLTVNPARLRFSEADEPPALLAWDAADPAPGPLWLSDVEVGRGYVAAVTVLAEASPNLVIDTADRGALPPSAIGGTAPRDPRR